MTLACGIEHLVKTNCPYTVKAECAEDAGKVVFSVDAQPGEPFQISKFISHHTSRSAQPQELVDRAERSLDRAMSHGFRELLESQKQYLEDFWERSDIQIEEENR